MTIVITTCTNRKRKPIAVGLQAASLAVGGLAEVAAEWGRRLREPTPLFPVMDVYGGRSFQEVKVVAEQLGADVFVISAGLGLIDASEEIPSYACTVADGAEDGIEPRVRGDFSSSEWWLHLKRVSPFARDLIDLVRRNDRKLILVALSDSYIRMLSEDLLALTADQLGRVRLFTRAPLDRIPARLQPCVMPYDDRLDGPESPIKGTRSDFAARALRHFSDYILPSTLAGPAERHRADVRSAIADWSYPPLVDRRRLTDEEILVLLKEHWDQARGSTSVLLRVFRDQLNVSCEQGRFAVLARQVRSERV